VLKAWLARPQKRNPLDGRTLEEIEHLFTSLERDFETRVVVLGGRGPSFCGGADRGNPPGASSLGPAAGDREKRFASQIGLRATRAVERCAAVTIARIQGHAVGGGLALAAACDFRIAAETAELWLPEVDLGIPLTWGATPRLIHEVGAARARQLVLLCDRVSGREAREWGLVHQAVPEAELDSAVDSMVGRILAKPEIAVHMTKTQFRAYAERASLGDVTETDGDLLRESSRGAAALESFSRPPRG